MAVNSTEVSYGFGQLGSIFHVGGDDAITSDTSSYSAADAATHDIITPGAVFVAITFIEDSVFESSNGLVSENAKRFPSTEGVSKGIDLNGGLVTDSVTFPKGLTIYGRWTQIDLNSGKCIAYIGY
tara:strand:+ start:47 stop:424 length:378 start_codon:yes stop_codon:yes gene_type:complete